MKARERRHPLIGARSQELRGTEAAESSQASRKMVAGTTLRQTPQQNPKERTSKRGIANILAYFADILGICCFTLTVLPIDVSDICMIRTGTVVLSLATSRIPHHGST